MAKRKTANLFKLPFKLPFFTDDTKTVQSESAVPLLKAVCFIVDWNKAHIISKVCEEEKVRFHFIARGVGTASSEMLDLIGIGAGDKAVIFCVEQEILIPVLYKDIQKKLGFYTPGAGIAFTIPLSGINTPLLRVFKDSISKNEKIEMYKEGEKAMAGEKTGISSETIKHDLIVVLINHGYSDDLMTTAREAGASGGTVINARGMAYEGPVKFFGLSVQEEKEVVIILTGREKKVPIMEAISRSCGITSKAEGLVFSLPVDSVMGLNLE